MMERIKDFLRCCVRTLDVETYLQNEAQIILNQIQDNEIIEAFKEDYKYNSSYDLVESLKNNDRFSFICEIQHTTDLRKMLDKNWNVDYFMRVLHKYLLD